MSINLFKLFTNIILIILCILNEISIAYGDCNIGLSRDPFLRPKVLLKIGSQKVDLILNDRDSEIILFNNQKIEAYCSTRFESPDGYNRNNKLNLECANNNIYVNRNYYGHHTILECSSLKWNLYETSHNFVWCPTNVTSYVLARPMESFNENYEYLAGICYDTHHLSFKSVYYTITPKHNEILQPTVLANFYKTNLELKYLKETFVMKSISETDYDNQDIQDWIKFAQYNFTSIIQNSLLYKEFNHQLGSLLDLPWWPSLRLGNWKRYERALTMHVEGQHQTYDILAGVSAVATAPIIETCKTNYTLSELIDNRRHEIPMYVWNYLRSTSNSSDEIVVIGFNSPFYEFSSEKDIVFCVDKCHEISWLKKVSTTFRYSPLGIMFCCTVEDVKSSKRLDGFAQINMETKPNTPNVKPEIDVEEEEEETTTESNRFYYLHHNY